MNKRDGGLRNFILVELILFVLYKLVEPTANKYFPCDTCPVSEPTCNVALIQCLTRDVTTMVEYFIIVVAVLYLLAAIWNGYKIKSSKNAK